MSLCSSLWMGPRVHPELLGLIQGSHLSLRSTWPQTGIKTRKEHGQEPVGLSTVGTTAFPWISGPLAELYVAVSEPDIQDQGLQRSPELLPWTAGQEPLPGSASQAGIADVRL